MMLKIKVTKPLPDNIGTKTDVYKIQCEDFSTLYTQILPTVVNKDTIFFTVKVLKCTE